MGQSSTTAGGHGSGPLLSDAVAEALVHGLLLVGPDRTVGAANAAAHTLLGVAPGSLDDPATLDLVRDRIAGGGDVDADEEPALSAALAGRTHASGAVRYRHPDGPLWLLVHARPTGDGVTTVVTLVDITGIKDASDEAVGAAAVRARLVSQLDRANADLAAALLELDRFAGAMAHDVKGPISNVLGFANLLADDSIQGLDHDDIIDRIRRNATQAADLVNDLLGHARLVAGIEALAPVSLNALVDEAIESVGTRAVKVAGTVTRDHLPWVLGSHGALRQAITNVLDNGLAYGRPGVPPQVHVSAEADDVFVLLRIDDNGVGIPEAQRQTAFRLGGRLSGADRPAPTGTGIGLAGAKSIIEHHHRGTIHLLDGPDGHGLRVEIRLRRAEPTTHEDRRTRVLVVDDDPDVAHMIRLFADDTGLDVTAVDSLAAARDRLATHPAPDIAVLDIRLPDGEGLALVPELHDAAPGTRVLLHSSHVDPDSAERARRAGVDVVIAKGGATDLRDALHLLSWRRGDDAE